jgi:shikimate 5-dehydrogenase
MHARQAGLVANTGLGMLIEQAALSFERWVGQKPSIQSMREAVIPAPDVRSQTEVKTQ